MSRLFKDTRRQWLPLACALAGLLTVGCAPAWGLAARGHAFGFAFEGAGEGALVAPSGVAVDEATGEVWVVDAGRERVDRFRPDGAGGFEYVSSLKVDVPGAIAVDNAPGSPSRGDVYVAGAEEPGEEAYERDYLYKFSASGEKLFKREVFKGKEGGEPAELELEDIQGVSVDASGVLWVYWEEEGVISSFSEAEANKWEPASTVRSEVYSRLSECPAAGAFAVAPDDEAFYVGYERENAAEECPGEDGLTPDPVVVAKLDQAGAIVSRETDRQNTTGAAVDPSSGDVYMDNVSNIGAYTPEGVLDQRFGGESLTGGSGVAVDGGTGEVFAAESTQSKVAVFVPEGAGVPVVDGLSAKALSASSERLSAVIDPHGLETEYFFEYGTGDCASAGSACSRVPVPAGELAAGYGDRSVSAEVTGLSSATAYYYRVQARNSAGGPVVARPSPNTFQTLPSPGALPDGRGWEMVSPPDKHGAQIEAQPLNGAMIVSSLDGNALTWVANGPVVGEPAGSRSPEVAQLLSVRGEGGWESQSLETPHDQGQGIETEPVPDEYQAFSSNLSLSLLAPAVPVAPGEANLGVSEAPPLSPSASEKTIYLRDDPPIEPAEAERAGYQKAGSEANRGYLYPGYLPLVDAANETSGERFGGGLEFQGATPDLQHVVLSSSASLLSGLPGSGELYEWTPPGSLQLVSVLPDGSPAGEPYLGDGEGQSSSPGLNSRNAISSNGSLVFFTDGKEHFYVHDSETGETVQVNAAQGNGATEPGTGGQTLPEPGEEQQETHFQTASSDGSRVFFTDTARLTEDSTLEPVQEEGQGPADLYEFQITSKPGEPLRGRLSDLTPEAAEESADVLNLIPGAGEDGEYVYFVANGVLAPGAPPGHCPRYYGEETPAPAGATCNLYVSEPDPGDRGQRQTRFIAALSDEDGADWGAGLTSHFLPSQDLAIVTSRVSPNGVYLAFMSQRSLTGYDNEDVSSQHRGERLDEEVYLYDAQTGRLACASCNPTGERPTGVYDTQKSGEGLGLLVDRSENWTGHWLGGSLPGWTLAYGHYKSPTYQPRYLDDSGRLFFDSPDALVPQLTSSTRTEEVEGKQQQVGVENVYEYEPESVGSCRSSGGCVGLLSSGTSTQESAFLDASESGEDAFFLTSAQLLPQDQDHAFDIYDARVCTAASPCLSPPEPPAPPCDSTGSCHGPAPGSAAQAPLPPSQTYAGPGNVVQEGVSASKLRGKPKPPTRAQQLARALKTCRKMKGRRRRRACEAKARKRFGPKVKTHKQTDRRSARRTSR
ncbi:MAG TPA: hypothetical protein VMB51_09155 [Solirubrobacteraceae bacterium]|nr:hypothetical protein [Solirubrobacteraceae bacterium]